MKVFGLLLSITLIFVAVLFPSCLQAQDPDAWEDRLNKRQPPEKVMDAIGVKPGMIIGEVGAGRGRYAVKFAERVGPKGKIYANDILSWKLEYLNTRCKRDSITNIETILGTETDPRLPKGKLDMVYLINTYHHVSEQIPVLKNIIPSLKPGGVLVVIEADPAKGGSSGHSTPKDAMLKQAGEAGYKLVRIETFLKTDNIYIFTPRPKTLK